MVCVKVGVMYCLLNGTILFLLWTFVLLSTHRSTSSNTLRSCMERFLFTEVLGRVYIVCKHGGVCESGWGHLCHQNGEPCLSWVKRKVWLWSRPAGRTVSRAEPNPKLPQKPNTKTWVSQWHGCVCVRSFVPSYVRAYESSSLKLENKMCF